MHTLGRYEIHGELGRGAISVVYDARDLLTDGAVALKLIEPSLWGQPTSAAERLAFLTEAMPGWRLNHPNVVTVYDAGDGDGKVYVAMERIAGPSLRRMIDETPLGVGRALRIAAEVAFGLAHAHERGVVHRGVTPSNILVQASDRPKITDFGLAPLQDAALAASNHAARLAYLSPEQIRCDRIDGRSDVFSLGVVLYEMLTGRLPFGGDSPAEVMRSVLESEPPLPSEQNSHVPPAVDGLVLSMLAKNPDDRAPSAQVIARNLRRVEDDLDGELAADGRYDEPALEALMTPGAHASGERDEAPVLRDGGRPRGPTPRPSTHALVALILAAAGVGALWQWRQSSDWGETRLATIGAEAATDIRAEPVTPIRPEPATPIRAEPATPIRGEPAPAVAPEAPLSGERRIAAPEPAQKKNRASKVAARNPPAGATANGPAPAPETPPPVVAFTAAPQPAVMMPVSSVSAASEAPPRTSRRAPPKTATVTVDVSPWGEIYVDGKSRGTTPPLKAIELPPGRHRIEVRNPYQPPYITFATLEAGEVRRIRHAFD